MAIEIDHSGKSALVTGAGAGIGREIAVWLARAGAQVAVLDKRLDKAEETVELIAAEGSKGVAVSGDARDDERLSAMIQEASQTMGSLDIAINNIGMMGSLGTAAWLDMTPQQFRDCIDQNLVLTGVACLKEAELMGNSGTAGVIINVTSGETTRPAPGLAAYGAAKSAINHLTQTLAVELGTKGIRVNAIAPGTTMTETVSAVYNQEQHQAIVDSTPLKMTTEPEELARLTVFLASDLARCITGQCILADAGAHLSRSRPIF